ncbi:uncharacterized protein LOC134721849 [Mytilus trossulus]|uniref:uncharacterized protein LOC134721849 n=1 Tax=Mytilus trossulus TaxID=6551 RepID=UPI0030064E26
MALSLLRCMRQTGFGRLRNTCCAVTWNLSDLAIPSERSQLTQKRCARMFPKNPFNRVDNDKLPEDFTLIYCNTNGEGLKQYFLMIFPSLLIIAGGVYTYGGLIKTVTDQPAFFFGVTSCIGLCLGCLLVINRCTMLRIYKNLKTDLYVGVRPKWFFLQEKFTFRLDNIVRNDWKYRNKIHHNYLKGNLKIKERPFVLSIMDFSSSQFYNEIYGHKKFLSKENKNFPNEDK